jgi:AcrR family transcriptional regulator
MPVRQVRKSHSYHHGDLRDALVASARAILEREGLDALSLRETARRAGVSQAAPYHHFADKQALLAAVAAKGFEELTAAMQSRMELESVPLARFTATGVGYVAFATRYPALFALMFGGIVEKLSSDPDLLTASVCAYNVLQDAARHALSSEGRSEADLPMTSLTAWSLVHGLSKLILEAEVSPANYGVKTSEELAALMLGKTVAGDKLTY